MVRHVPRAWVKHAAAELLVANWLPVTDKALFGLDPNLRKLATNCNAYALQRAHLLDDCQYPDESTHYMRDHGSLLAPILQGRALFLEV